MQNEVTRSVVDHPAKQAQFDRFYTILACQYQRLLETPEYAMAAARYTPEEMARKMTCGLAAGTASKDGEGIKCTCKALGVAYTYKAIREYLGA